ncbi:MAG: hypothetical protein WCO42_01710 [bacterium]
MKIVSLCLLTLIGGMSVGCSSIKIVEGNVAPPLWVAEPTLASKCDPTNYVYASGMSTYTLVLEEGINDARHDAIRKLAERAGVTADDIYRTSRSDKYSSTQVGMPNVPQIIQNSHAAVQTSGKLESKTTLTPQATHTTQIRLHDVDQALICYTVWQYGPSLWARCWDGDTALRFYDVYVLMRCPKTEFEAALKKERTADGYEITPLQAK